MAKPVFGCLPLYAPLELFHSFGLNPVTLWGFKGPAPQGDVHLQSFACSVARRLVEYVLSDKGRALNGLFAYNACDTIRNLPEILQTGLREAGREVPVFTMHVPQYDSMIGRGQDYLRTEIKQLITSLEEVFHAHFDWGKFQASVQLFQQQRQLARQLEEHATRGRVKFTDFARLLAESAALPVETQIAQLTDALKAVDVDSEPPEVEYQDKTIISGILPPPPAISALIEDTGFRVVGNDVAVLNRSYAGSPVIGDDAMEYYVDLYYRHVPCPTLLFSADHRLEHLLWLASTRGAKSIIFVGEKYCECEFFEFPYLQEHLRTRGIESILLEVGMDDEANIAPFQNRIEAFAEMLGVKAKKTPVESKSTKKKSK